MSGLGGSHGPADGITPGRRVDILFDDVEHRLLRKRWSAIRYYSQIAPQAARDKAIDGYQATNLYHWASGCWTLRPIQLRPWQMQEKAVPSGTVLSVASVLSAPGSQRPMFRNFSETGASPGSDNAANGNDKFFQKTIEAGTSWASGVLSAPTAITEHTDLLASPPDVLGEAQPVPTQPLDAILHVAEDMPANQSLTLRFQVSGLGNQSYQYIGALYFGQYGLLICGDGMAELWEYARKEDEEELRWFKRSSFRYCKADRVSGGFHTLIIFPHVGLNKEKFISFASAEMDSPGTGTAGHPAASGFQTNLTNGEYLYRWDELLTQSADRATDLFPESPLVAQEIVTVEGDVWLHERRDLRGLWQVSATRWAKSGVLMDLSLTQSGKPWGVVEVTTFYAPKGDSDIETVLLDGETDLPWDGIGNTPDPLRLRFEFSSPSQSFTPILWGYKAVRPSLYEYEELVPFRTSYDSQQGLSFRQGERISSGEDASFTVNDVGDEYPILANRGEIPLTIQTTFDPPGGGDTVDLKLWRGFAIQPYRDQIGRSEKGYGAGNLDAPRAYPSPEWSDYGISAVGMWHRLTAETTTLRTALSLRNFANDETDAQKRPWKVTAAMAHLLESAGFPPSMYSLPVSDVRLSPGVAGEQSDLVIDMNLSVGDLVVRMARMYFGMYLVFDVNAGTRGKWKLVGAPTDTTPLVNFVTTSATPTGSNATFQLPLHPGGYPAGTVPIISRVQGYPIAPEANHIWVLNKVNLFNNLDFAGIRVENNLYNHLSYNVPFSSVIPNRNSPHYIGSERLLVIADQALWAGAGATSGGYEANQRVINFILFRLFIAAGMGRRLKRFKVPLQPIEDEAESTWRLPRFYDPCTINGEEGWYIKSYKPHMKFDHLQMADVECERLVPYMWTPTPEE